jgi:hypothetical protein
VLLYRCTFVSTKKVKDMTTIKHRKGVITKTGYNGKFAIKSIASLLTKAGYNVDIDHAQTGSSYIVAYIENGTNDKTIEIRISNHTKPSLSVDEGGVYKATEDWFEAEILTSEQFLEVKSSLLAWA